MKKRTIFILLSIVLLGVIFLSLLPEKSKLLESQESIDIVSENYPTRESKIPDYMAKITPETDMIKPVLHSNEFKKPVPVPGQINTAGAEDSPFITPNGKTFFVWFTPDPNIPPEKQLIDGVTGIYSFEQKKGIWQNPKRVMLQNKGKLALDGCEFVQGNKMWFCSIREGYTGMQWFTTEYKEGKWQDWKEAEFNPEYQIGELHITADGKELYFHSPKGNKDGNYDIWVSENMDGKWQEPEKIDVLNTKEFEGWPYINNDKTELWFTRTYKGMPAIYRSKNINNEWQEPELIISHFAGEPTLDNGGNLYFTHHYYKDNKMLEADIYVAYGN